MSLALQTHNSGVIADDFTARKCARELNISFIGTGGLLISAKQKHLIPSVSEALEKVQEKGLRLSDIEQISGKSDMCGSTHEVRA